ncbi:MAG: preprotein translocase subunit SecG [Candidatus Competibacteraceae bacterium]
MQAVLLIVHVIIAVALIVLILLQHGKGADAGAAFGSGASATVFGARGAASFLSRVTAGLAAGFFITSLLLGYSATRSSAPSSVVERVPAVPSEQMVVKPGEPAAKPDEQAAKPGEQAAQEKPAAPATPADVPQAPPPQPAQQ